MKAYEAMNPNAVFLYLGQTIGRPPAYCWNVV